MFLLCIYIAFWRLHQFLFNVFILISLSLQALGWYWKVDDGWCSVWKLWSDVLQAWIINRFCLQRSKSFLCKRQQPLEFRANQRCRTWRSYPGHGSGFRPKQPVFNINPEFRWSQSAQQTPQEGFWTGLRSEDQLDPSEDPNKHLTDLWIKWKTEWGNKQLKTLIHCKTCTSKSHNFKFFKSLTKCNSLTPFADYFTKFE